MIPIFPEHALDNSLHTAILVGLVVTWLLFEAFGWVFAGFVVAGYLAALGMVAPPSLAVVLVESILCYGLVWIVASGLSRLGFWSAVFGRERFLLFVLLALPVRLVVTGLAMPTLTARLLGQGVEPDALGHGLFGVGIVLVPLTANTFWKLGLSRGLVQIGVSGGLTWVLLSQVLARVTNFGFGEFEGTFDTLAVSAWESSRVVLVLVCTVFFGARNNLRYGWDFGGILVPALLAMLVFTPLKLVSTLVEILVLTVVYKAVLGLPGLRSLDLEGPRRIVSIFLVAYLWKWGTAVAADALQLPVRASDLYGFGYLLTSLVVARGLKSGSVLRTLVPTVWTTAQGVLTALPLGYALTLLVQESAPGNGESGSLDDLARDVPLAAAKVARDPTNAPGDVSCVGCGRPGPMLLVLRPHGDPDTGWLAGWLAARGGVGGVLLPGSDPSEHPTRYALADQVAARAVRQARAAAGDAPLWVVVGTEGPPRLYPKSLAPGLAAVASLGVPALATSVGAVPEQAMGWWGLLGPNDGVLALPATLPATTQPARLSWSDPLGALPLAEAAPEDLVPLVVLPALRRAAHRGALAGRMVGPHLAALAGGTWDEVEAPDTSVHGLFRRPVDGGLGEDRWWVRMEGGEGVVIATDAYRWPGVEAVAASAHVALRAQTTWISGHPPRDPGRWPAWDDPARAWMDRVTRALLLPPSDWRSSGADHPSGSVVVIEVAPPGTERVLVGDGDVGLHPPPIPGLAAWLDAWPGHASTGTHPGAAAWLPGLAYALSYGEAVFDGGLAVVWLPASVLREPRTAPDAAALAAWAVTQGVTVEGNASPSTVGPTTEAEAARRRDLQRLADAPTDRALAGFRATWGGRLGMRLTERRVQWWHDDDRTRCTAVRGGPVVGHDAWSACGARP